MSAETTKRWRKNTKNKILSVMGNKCYVCGYFRSKNALELHHLIPSEKEFNISESLKIPKKWEIIENEIKKCVLLCVNCHREVHDNILTFKIENEKIIFKYIE